jgi:type II secretory ATPase GspE/PulE/Tfp pilus assembly ATPase PilB-like protein
VLKRATSDQIEEVAKKNGMISMREDGYLKALNGLTTIQEVDRVAAENLD